MNPQEMIMKRGSTAKAFTIAAVFTLALAVAPIATAEARPCSNATLRGTYSDTDTGTIVGAGPFAGVNLDTFDGKGALTVSGMSSVNGSISPFAATGTYTVNRDCTGTYSVSDAFGDTFNAYFVIDEGGNELQIVITNPGTVINCIARKQFPEDED
jgi:hypothetical protein